MQFEFMTAGRIIYGRGVFQHIGQLIAERGRNILIVRGGNHLEQSGILKRLQSDLDLRELKRTFYTVQGETTPEAVAAVLEAARKNHCDAVIGLGGGSVIDAAKAAASLSTNGGDLFDYLEGIGSGQQLTKPALPLIAVPTTSGTGSEVTKNAVITVAVKKAKVSLRSPHLIPAIALVDPQLTDHLPSAITASTGLDALSQLIETYVTKRANPMTDSLSLTGIRLCARSLHRVFQNGQDQDGRDDLALAALLSGICLANAGLGAIHGLAAPLGACFPIPHGVACGRLLPSVIKANIDALNSLDRQNFYLSRFVDVAEAWLGTRRLEKNSMVDSLVHHLNKLISNLNLPSLKSFGVSPQDLPMLAEKAKYSSSMRGNPVMLSENTLIDILRQAL
jgi:alcohol dehydrogenase class IV